MEMVDESKHKKGSQKDIDRHIDNVRKAPVNKSEVVGTPEWHQSAVDRNKKKGFTPGHS